MGLIKEFLYLDFKSQIYIVFISCFWLIGYFGAFWRRLGMADNAVIVANFILLTILASMCARKWHNRIRISDVALYLLLTIVYFSNAVIYPRTVGLVYDYSLQVVLATFPFMFIGFIFKYNDIERWIVLLSRLAILINLVYSFSISTEMDFEEQMNRAYVLLPSVLYLIWLSLERVRLIDIIFALIGFYIECSMGSRGPFICIVFFVAAYLFFFKKYKHTYLMRTIIVAVALVFYTIASRFAYLMVALLSLTGKNTRIFDLMLDDSLINYSESTGRDMIQDYLLNRLRLNSSGTGFGLLADRLEGTYAHNLFVEIWYSYGYIIGSILVGVFLLLVLRFVIKSTNNDSKVIVLLFFTVSFVKLMFSSSFIVDQSFFFLIGFCINGLRESKLQNKYASFTMSSQH